MVVNLLCGTLLVVFTDNFDKLALGQTRFLQNKRTQVFDSVSNFLHFQPFCKKPAENVNFNQRFGVRNTQALVEIYNTRGPLQNIESITYIANLFLLLLYCCYITIMYKMYSLIFFQSGWNHSRSLVIW